MAYQTELPWPKIYDYLTEVSAEPDLESFFYKAIERLTDLVPYDSSFAVLFDENGYITPNVFVKEIPEKSLREYLEYYQFIDSCRFGEHASTRTNYAEWKSSIYRNNEFYADFIRPLNYSCSSGILLRNQQGGVGLTIGLNRVDGRGLTVRELQILETIQPYLENLFWLYQKIDHLKTDLVYTSRFSRGCKFLTKREREIASLLHRHLTAAEIATKLLVSRRTVEFHIMNIYEKLKVKTRRELILKLSGENEK